MNFLFYYCIILIKVMADNSNLTNSISSSTDVNDQSVTEQNGNNKPINEMLKEEKTNLEETKIEARGENKDDVDGNEIKDNIDRKRKLDSLEKEVEENGDQIDKKLRENDDGGVKRDIDDVDGKVEPKGESKQEFAYSKRKDFTSEIYKIIVKGLPKYFGVTELKRHFEKLTDVKICKLVPMGRKKTKESNVFVTFYNDEARDIALKKIDGYTYKNKILSAKKATAQPDPFFVKQKSEAELKTIEESCSEHSLKDNICPLWNVSYEKQLEIKMDQIKRHINTMVLNIEQNQPELKVWFNSQREKYNDVPVELVEIRTAKRPEGYRNKCEFTIGLHPKTKEKTVGFRYGKYSQGSVYVGPVYDLVHIPQRMKDAAMVIENYIRQSSFDIFDVVHQKGHWKQLMCRYSEKTDQLLMKIGFDPGDLQADKVNEVKSQLKDFFENNEHGKKLNCTSVNFHLMPRRVPPGESAPEVELLSGSPTITEKLYNLSFNISPVSFFQINTDACQILYDSVAELANLDKETTLMDICSGVGTIGLCLANRCGEVLGVEYNENAVKDAKLNAENNNITNCNFYHGKAEQITTSIMNTAKYPKLVAVVDPPRAGVHASLASSLRASNIDTIVYLACDVKSVLSNFNGLTNPQSKKFPKSPFIPTKIIPVDMFPYTHGVEWVVCLQRYDKLVAKE